MSFLKRSGKNNQNPAYDINYENIHTITDALESGCSNRLDEYTNTRLLKGVRDKYFLMLLIIQEKIPSAKIDIYQENLGNNCCYYCICDDTFIKVNDIF